MPAIMADHNVEGHLKVLLRIIATDPWCDVWDEMGYEVTSFDRLNLRSNASDIELWQACQEHDVVLITANRNRDGPDSLEATIKRFDQPEYLPVLTVSDPDQILTDHEYGVRVVSQLLEYLLDMENYRGAGRLYLP